MLTEATLSPFVRKLLMWRPLSDEEQQAVLSLAVRSARRRAGASLMSEERMRERYCILLSGYGQLQRFDASGVRQIQALYLPGDLIDLDIVAGPYRVESLVPSLVGYLDRVAFAALIADSANIREAVCTEIFAQNAICREWLFNVARREAFERLCHFLCEVSQREMDAAVSDGRDFALSMTQVDIGDVLGLTPVHVNRTLRRLRDAGLVSQERRKLKVEDRARLEHACGFDSSYLYPSAP